MNLVDDTGKLNLQELKTRLLNNFDGILNGMPTRFNNPETGYPYRYHGEYETVMQKRWNKFWQDIENEYNIDLEEYKISNWDRIDND